MQPQQPVQLSPDGAYWWDGTSWRPVPQAPPPPPPPPAPEPTLGAAPPPPPPGVAPPSWLAAGQQMPDTQPQAFVPVQPVTGYAGFTPAWSEPAPARRASWPIAFSLNGGLSQLGVVGGIVWILMVFNTLIALNTPIGTGRYVLPLGTIAVCIRRALQGRWLAVFVLGGTWLVCIGLIQARGGP